jgi:acyl carrier protein
MAAGSSCRECELIKELIAERAGVGADGAAILLDGHLPNPHDHDDALVSLGGSMVGGAVPTAAAPPTVAHTPAPDRLETRGSTASRLAERRDELLPEVAPAQLTPRAKVPGRTSRPQAVPPRPGVREPLRGPRDHICPRRRDPRAVLATIRRLVAEITEVDACGVAIARSTSFDADLELEGDDLVALGRRLREAYGPDVDVPAWFGELDIDDLVTLTAGDVTDFVVWCLG